MNTNEPNPMNASTPRTITDHTTNPVNDRLTITIMDPPGAGGASHRYEIRGFNTETNTSRLEKDDYFPAESLDILFQNGPIAEAGVNGITQEVLLAIVIDRLNSFQKGPYACEENRRALEHVEAALDSLKHRTIKRMERGVEGTHTV